MKTTQNNYIPIRDPLAKISSGRNYGRLKKQYVEIILNFDNNSSSF